MMKLIAGVENHPWWTVLGVGAITVGFLAAILLLGIKSETDFLKFMPQDNPAVAAFNGAKETYGSQDLFLISLMSEDTIFNAATLLKFKQLEEELAGIPGVETVRGPATADVIYGTENAIVVEKAMPTVPQTAEEIRAYKERVLADRNLKGWVVSEDGKAGAISLKLALGADVPAMVKRIQAVVSKYEGPERAFMAGQSVLRSTIADTMAVDMQRLIPFVILVMILVLFASFRSLRGVLLPLVVVILSVIWALGTMALFDQPMTPFAVIMPVMLIAIGAADGIHILNKYNEAAAKSSGGRRAVVLETMREMVKPVVLTSVTTAAGFLALTSSFLWPQRSLGVITAAGVIYAMILSLTLIPALLARLPLPRQRQQKEFSKTFISNCLAFVARVIGQKPLLTVGAAFVLLAIFAAAVPQVRIETKPDEFLGEDHPVIAAMQVMDEKFGGSLQMAIEIRTGQRDGLKNPEVLKQIVALQDYLLSFPKVGQVSSIAKVVMQMNETLHASDPAYYAVPEDPRLAAQIFILYSGDLDNLALADFSRGEVMARVNNMGSKETIALVEDVNAYLEQNFSGAVQAELVGSMRQFAALVPLISTSQITSLLYSMGAAFLMLALLMRSLLGGVISVIPLLFTIVIAFGAMTFADVALDMATLMLGSIAIGIGVDYSIHFVSRYQREISAGKTWKQAYDVTMRTSGKGIFYNAAALLLSFAVLMASSFQGNVNFGRMVVLTMVVSSVSAMTVIPTLFLLIKPRFMANNLKER